MPETIKEPKKGESILEWARRAARELTRLGRLLEVGGSGGLEVIGGTLRATRADPGLILVRVGTGGIPAKVGTVPGSSPALVFPYVWDGTNLTVGTVGETARNFTTAAFDANRDVWCTRRWGILWAVVQACQ